MAVKTRPELKAYFVTGATPTETQFANLIDTLPVAASDIGAEPANANIQSHISSTSNPHSVTASQVGAVATTGNETIAGEKTFSDKLAVGEHIVMPYVTQVTPVAQEINVTQTEVTGITTTGILVNNLLAASTDSLATINAEYLDTQTDPLDTNDYRYVVGSHSVIRHAGEGNITNVYGYWAGITPTGTGNTSKVYGFHVHLLDNSNSTTDTFYGVDVAATSPGAGTINNAYGIYLGTLAATNRWSIFSEDSGALAWFAGNLSAGGNLAVTGTSTHTGATNTSNVNVTTIASATPPIDMITSGNATIAGTKRNTFTNTGTLSGFKSAAIAMYRVNDAGATGTKNATDATLPRAADNLGNIIYGLVASGVYKNTATITAITESEPTLSLYPTYLSFSTSHINGAVAALTEKLRISSIGNVSIPAVTTNTGGGKLLIGSQTSTGTELLQVTGSSVVTGASKTNALITNARTVTDADATFAADDYTIRMSTGASARTVNLSAAVVGQLVVVKKIDSGAGTVGFVSGTSCTIDGLTTRTLSAQYESFTMQCVTAGAACVFDII